MACLFVDGSRDALDGFRAKSKLQNLFRREPHSVRLERMTLHLSYEVRFVVGSNLEAAVALQYRLHASPRR